MQLKSNKSRMNHMPVKVLSDYFHTHLVLPNTQPDRNINLLVAMLLTRPYQIAIGQKKVQ